MDGLTLAQVYVLITTRYKQKTRLLREMLASTNRHRNLRQAKPAASASALTEEQVATEHVTRPTKAARAFEKDFDFIVPTGQHTFQPGFYHLHAKRIDVFSKKQTSYSGLIGFEYADVANVESLATALLSDSFLVPSIVLLYRTAFGNGLCVIIATDRRIWHKHNYDRIIACLQKRHPHWRRNLLTHTSSTAWPFGLCYDPNAYLSPNHESPMPFPMKKWLLKRRTAHETRFSQRHWKVYHGHEEKYIDLTHLR